MAEDFETQDNTAIEDINPLTLFWRLFNSMKTAVVLLLVLAAVSMVITFIESRYGIRNLYYSGWYIGLLGLVSLNLLICSINRFRSVWHRTFRPVTIASSDSIAGMQRTETLAGKVSVSATSDSIVSALRTARYRVTAQRDGESTVVLFAVKGLFGIWGPYLTHLSVLVILIGAVMGSIIGFHGYMIIPEGQYADSCYLERSGERRVLGFRIELRDFRIEHDEHHNPTGYKSYLVVYDKGRPVAEKVIDVNDPLSYKGISFFQADYGLAQLVIRVTDPAGKSERFLVDVDVVDTGAGKQYAISRPWLETEDGKLTLYLHGFVPDYVGGRQISASDVPINPAVQLMANEQYPERRDSWERLEWLEASQFLKFKGFTIGLEKVIDYTRLDVSYNPALIVVYLGFALMLIGVFLSFYVCHKVIRARISESEDGVTVLLGAISKSEPSVFGGDFDRVRKSLQ